MKKYLVIASAGIVALAAVYLWGYWPENRKRIALERELVTAQARLAELEARDGLGQLEGKLLALAEAIDARDFVDARQRSTDFFDAVRSEAARPGATDRSAALAEIEKNRDAVTTGLVKEDPKVADLLQSHMDRLRKLLGQPFGARSKSI